MNNKFVQKKGKILVLLKMFKEAEIQCDKSIELDSKNPEIFVLKGNLFDFLFENILKSKNVFSYKSNYFKTSKSYGGSSRIL